MERKFKFATQEFYHLYNRGTDKRQIFAEENDYRRFLVLLHLCNNTEIMHFSNLNYGGRAKTELLEIQIPERLTAVGAYCLMPNHFHLLVRETTDGGISRFMQKLLTAYSMYFNTKYERNGNLFQGRFKAEHANDDRYLKYLFAYIHLNPVKLVKPHWRETGPANKEKIKRHLASYPYSSYHEHCTATSRPEAAILTRSVFPDYFQNTKESLEELYACLDIKAGP